VNHPEKMEEARSCSMESVQKWTLDRSAKGHLKVYQLIQEGKKALIQKLFSSSGWKQLKKIKLYEDKKKAFSQFLQEIDWESESQGSVLWMGPGVDFISKKTLLSHQRIPGRWTEDLMQGRLEILPYENEDFDTTVMICGLETSFLLENTL